MPGLIFINLEPQSFLYVGGMTREPVDLIDIIGCEEARSIPGLLFERAARDGDRAGLAEFREGALTDITWRQVSQKVGQFRAALDTAGMRPGDRVALLLPNGMDWVAFDIAAMANGLITVPLYMHDSPENACSILENAGARLCFLDSLAKWQSLAPMARGIDSLELIWVRTGSVAGSGIRQPKVRGLAEVLSGDSIPAGDFRCGPDDIATIIYTSGTTGKPKGVMLSHRALLWNAEAITKIIPPLKSDVFFSVLPAAHAFERTMGYHLPIMCGSRIAYARSTDTLREDIRLVRPTVLTAVPRLYERFHDAILDEVAAHPIARKLTLTTADIGWRVFEARQGRGKPPGVVARQVLWPILRLLVGRRVLAAFGGRLRVAVSGGAPLQFRTSHFLIGLGLPLIEGYGLTEAAPVVTGASLDDNEPGSVGRPVQGVDVRLSEEGELLIRSRSMMKGYWQDPERTAEVLDAEGWLRTGDLAEIRSGRVFIKGRRSDLIVLSTAKKVAPTEVEAKIQRDPLFEQVCVLGDDRPCLVAVAVLNLKAWTKLAADAGLDAAAPNSPAAKEAIHRRIADATADLAPFSQVRNLHALLQPWTVEDGTLTPTLKVRRHVVSARYQSEIDALFRDIAAQRAREEPGGAGQEKKDRRIPCGQGKA